LASDRLKASQSIRMRVSQASHISSIDRGAMRKPREVVVTTMRSLRRRFRASRMGEKLLP